MHSLVLSRRSLKDGFVALYSEADVVKHFPFTILSLAIVCLLLKIFSKDISFFFLSFSFRVAMQQKVLLDVSSSNCNLIL